MRRKPRARILLLAPKRPGDGFGGAEQHLADLAGILGQLSSEVRFIGHSDVPPAGALHQLLVRAMPLLQSPLAVRRLLRHGMPEADIILSLELMGVGVRHPRHLHLFFGSYAGFRAQALQSRAGWRGPLGRWVADKLAVVLERRTQGAQGSLANSLGLRDCLRAHQIPARCEVIPPPIDTHRFRPGDKMAARVGLGLPQSKRLVLFAGRWEFAKGADRITAIASLLPPECHVVIAAPAVTSWPWPSASNITKLQDVSNMEMATVYQAVDVLIQPSRFEGYSLVASEAQACGCPVLTSDVGHAAHFAQSASPFIRGSVISDADNPLAWIEKIQEILPPRALAQARAASREYAEEHVSLEVVQLLWSHLLRTLYPEYEWRPR